MPKAVPVASILSFVLAACSASAPAPSPSPSSSSSSADAPPAAPATPATPATPAAQAGGAAPSAPGAGTPSASPDPLPAAFEGATIPARFHGVYSSDGECGDRGTDSRLVIQADTVEFHESRGRVLRARGEGDSLEVVLSLAGEGQTREATYAFGREAGGEELLDTRNGMRRVRCAEKAPG